MNRTGIIIAAAAFVFAVLAGILLLSLPEPSEPTTAAIQAIPAEPEVTDAGPAKPEEPAIEKTPPSEEPAVVMTPPPEEPAVVKAPETTSDPAPAQAAQSPSPPAEPVASAEPATPAATPAPAAAPELAATPEPAPEPKPTVVAELVPPGFDVVRVETTGETVLAGRAMAGSEVSVLDSGASLGEVRVDGLGQWAFVVDKPLAPGSHELSLVARLADGRVVTSTDVVVVNVPQPQIAAAPQASPQQPTVSAAAAESA